MEELHLSDMMKAGVHFGHQKSKFHPAMAPYIFTTRNNILIINLEKTGELLREALAYLSRIAGEGKTVLFVGTKPPIRKVVEETAQACGMLFVVNRWLGGTFTNFSVVSKRIEYLKDLEAKRAAGELAKYTKKEQLIFGEEIKRLNDKFKGIKTMTRLPDAMFVVDIDHDALAVKEARQLGIPVVAMTDTNTDPKLVNYPIPANDDAVSSVKFILEAVAKAIEEGKRTTPAASPATETHTQPVPTESNLPAEANGL